MFKYLALLALLTISLSTLQVYSPECAVKRFPKFIEYTLSNFGDIPYGEILIGQIRLPNSETLCGVEGETYINNKDPNMRIIMLVKRGICKFTQKVIHAQNLGADLIIIYDDKKGETPSIIMKNDGHGHLAQIPSLFISNKDGENLKVTKDCSDLPVVKVKFEIEQAEVSKVILWLDANNRESFILAREFYKNDYYKILQDKIDMNVRFRVDTHCKEGVFCSKADCVGVIKEIYCRSVEKPSDDADQGKGLSGRAVIEEQLRQYFLWEQLSHNNKMEWWKYMTKFDHEDCIGVADIKDCSYTAMKNLGISESDTKKIESLVQETIQNTTEGKTSILKETAMESSELGIYFYPEATINNRNFYGLFKASEVFEMICDSLINPPKECITFIKNNNQIDTNGTSSGLWTTIFWTVLLLTLGFIVALIVYTKFLRKEVDQQLSVQVNKLVQNYVTLADKKKKSSTGNSYSKFDS